jgi:large subunit ribosomal protein L31
MKKDTHPELHPAIFIDSSCGKEFVALSTLTSDETRDRKGVKHFVHRIEISSASHPFYTGKQILVDTARRAEKFAERAAKQATASVRLGKKVKRAKAVAKKTAKKAAKMKKEEKTEEST